MKLLICFTRIYPLSFGAGDLKLAKKMKAYILFSFMFLLPNIKGQLNVKIEDVKNFKSTVDLHPDTGLNISQLLEKYNYPLEFHEVSTEDGFILRLDRIPYGQNETHKNVVNKPAVLFVHGLASSSIDWLFLGPNNSLALLLADTGYDVWLLSTRGTAPSMQHKYLNSSDPAFWDYSWHEKGYYDLASSLDHITNTSNVPTVTLIGHSEGTTDLLVLPITRPEYNEKINLLVLLSPIAYMGNLSSPLMLIMVKHMEAIQEIAKALNISGIAYSPTISSAGIAFCSDESPFIDICADFLGLLCGFDSPQLNKTYLSLFLSNKPAGLSVKELVHYGQEIRSGFFRQYDYGNDNLIYYGSAEPPVYDPTKITAPVAAYYGKNDFFAAVEDVQRLLSLLPNIAQDYLVEYELFNHADFILAKDVKTLLYDQVISDIEKYNPVTN